MKKIKSNSITVRLNQNVLINLSMIVFLAIFLIVSAGVIQYNQKTLDGYVNEKLTLEHLNSLVIETEKIVLQIIILKEEEVAQLLATSEDFQSAFDSFYDAVLRRNSLNELSLAREFEPVIAALRADIMEVVTLYRLDNLQSAKAYYANRLSTRVEQVKRFTGDEIYFLNEIIKEKRNTINILTTYVFTSITLITLAIGVFVFVRVKRLTDSIIEPIKKLAMAMSSIASGDYGHRLVIQSNDEFSDLADTLNSMSNEIMLRDEQLLRSITLHEKDEAKLRHIANYDSLTELPNRRLFREKTLHALALAKRYGRKLSIMYLDLDGFKQVNDSLGHSIGDKLLTIVAERLNTQIRSSDTLARLGGDEFALLLEDVNSEEAIGGLAHKLLSSLNNLILIDGHEITISCSIGITNYPEDGKDVESLLMNADAAMYSAKNKGGSDFHFYLPSMNERALDRLILKNDLFKALERSEFFLVYQPKISLTTSNIIGAEVLLRWQHPTKGLIAPDQFISLAEETGLIIPIGRWVLQTACEKMMKWEKLQYPTTKLAVNVSVKQFATANYCEEVKSILAATKLPPEYLELELTESLLMDTGDSSINILSELKDLGINLSIDDFGTGYSSLQYLSRFPIDLLKIDRSFVAGLGSDEKSETIVRAIIAMSKGLGLKVIAEGVENEEQVELLRHFRCDYSQGYFHSKPLKEKDFLKYINVPVMSEDMA